MPKWLIKACRHAPVRAVVRFFVRREIRYRKAMIEAKSAAYWAARAEWRDHRAQLAECGRMLAEIDNAARPKAMFRAWVAMR